MGGNDCLNLATVLPIPQQAQEGQLSGRGQCHFRFVQQLKGALGCPEPVVEQRKEGFAVTLVVQVPPPVIAEISDLVDVTGEPKEALRPEEKTV